MLRILALLRSVVSRRLVLVLSTTSFLLGESLAAPTTITLTGEAPYDHLGSSVSAAGDLNGDGYDDVVVGAERNDSGGADAGRVYIHFGGSVVDAVADLVITGPGMNADFGTSVANAGDVNGDGHPDLIVGAYGFPGGLATGRAYIYHGGPAMDDSPDRVLNGNEPGSAFGIWVSGVGDVNGDGLSDVVVGAPQGGSGPGHAYVYFGGSGDAPDLVLTGEAPVDRFGGEVSSAGDINGDGYPDILVGAAGNDAGGNSAGRVYVFYGGPDVDDAADVVFTGNRPELELGRRALSGAGDVNGDGYDDVVAGVYLHDTSGATVDRAYVFYGGPAADGLPDVALRGPAEASFNISVSGAGDVNADGYDDLIVGIYTQCGGCPPIGGGTYLFLGAAVPTSEAALTLPGSSAVSGAGDVNGDGRADIILGFFLDDAAGPDAGAALIQLSETRTLGVTVDLDPDMLELSSHGRWVTAYIEPEGFDPTDIDVSSIRLAGSIPAEAKFGTIGDHDGDDVPGLTVKFGRQALAPLLTIGVNQLEVTGTLVTGESFAGMGEVTVMDSGADALSLQLVSPLGAAPVQFAIRDPGTASHHVAVYDVQGRLLRKWSGPVSGTGPISWDGRGDAGQVGSGIYFIRVVEGVREATLKVVLAR